MSVGVTGIAASLTDTVSECRERTAHELYKTDGRTLRGCGEDCHIGVTDNAVFAMHFFLRTNKTPERVSDQGFWNLILTMTYSH
ncbi:MULTISPECIES: hypothetical protein, partial [unclassified Pseudomonas]|uniref:hypothetical protein n=1 Tax=unclassified Pseudomonas TaxID=196821 RepID=UPI002B234A67